MDVRVREPGGKVPAGEVEELRDCGGVILVGDRVIQGRVC